MKKITHNILINITTFIDLRKMLSARFPSNTLPNHWLVPVFNTLYLTEYSTIDICTYNDNIYTYSITRETPKKMITYSISIHTTQCINSDELLIHCHDSAAIKDNLKNEIWLVYDTVHKENGPAVSLWGGRIKQWYYYGTAANYLEHNDNNWKQRVALEYFG